MAVIMMGGSNIGKAPNLITGCTGWWKADAGVYVDAGVTLATNGQTVQQWNDQIGTGHFTQGTAGGRPTFVTNAKNGLPVVRFGGVADDDFMGNATANSSFMTNSAKTIMMVIMESVAQLNNYWGSSDNNIRLRISDPNWSCVHNDGAADTASKTTTAITNYYSCTFMHSGGSIYAGLSDTRDASLVSAVSGNTAAMTGTPVLGSDNAGANAVDGDIAEVAVFNVALSETDRKDIEMYYAFRYGLSLPY